jgi:hypothetical protein
MSVIEKFLSKYAKGEMITQKMLMQSCRLDKGQASRYISYLIKIGLGKPIYDGLGLRAISYIPNGDQRTRVITQRDDSNNKGRKWGVKKPRSYVRNKLEEFHIEPGPMVNPPKPAYVPPPVYAADPAMLEKLDTITAGLKILADKFDLLIKVWSTS